MVKRKTPNGEHSPAYTKLPASRRQRDWSQEGKPFSITDEDARFVRSLVVFEDQHVLALNKPSGISAQAGKEGIKTIDRLLTAFAKSNGKRPQLVHRLDRETSGVLLAARTYPAAGFLGKAFAARDTSKRYVALACGNNLPDEGVFETPLKRWRDPRGFDAMQAGAKNDSASELAETQFHTLARGPGWRLLSVSPITGRMHQIRAHLALAGAPIAGDQKYGGLGMVGDVLTPRLMLHACSLDVPHPEGGRVQFTAPLPEDFCGMLTQLGAGDAIADL